MAYIVILIVSVIGGIIQSTMGFGFGIIAMSVFPFLIDSLPESAAITAFISMLGSTTVLARYYKHIQLKYIIPTLIANFVVMPICTHFSILLPTRILSLALGFTMIVLCIFYLYWKEKTSIRPTICNAAVAGGLGGMMGGLFSLGGIPVGVYLINAIEDKNIYYATIQAYLVLSDLYGSSVRIFNGIITMDTVPWIVIGSLGMLGGIQVGKCIYARLNQDATKKLVYVFIGISGLYKVASFFLQ